MEQQRGYIESVLMLGVLVIVLAVAKGQSAPQQTPQPAVAPTSSTVAAKPKAVKPSAAKSATTPAPAKVQRIPLESAPPTAGTAATAAREAQQKAADQRLLEQQQAQSAAAARVTNAIAEKAQRQQDKVQNEIRIQDAPGPAQTGVVPAAGPPVVPAKSSSQDIQEAPGPAQTLAPAQPATVATPPPQR